MAESYGNANTVGCSGTWAMPSRLASVLTIQSVPVTEAASGSVTVMTLLHNITHTAQELSLSLFNRPFST